MPKSLKSAERKKPSNDLFAGTEPEGRASPKARNA